MNITERVKSAQLPRYDTNQDTESRNPNQWSRFKITLPGKSCFDLLGKSSGPLIGFLVFSFLEDLITELLPQILNEVQMLPIY